MKNIKYLLSGLLAIGAANLNAQEVEPTTEVEMSADRPGASTGTGIVGKYKFQWETGFGYERNNIDHAGEHTYTLNTSLFRFGLSENAELRLGVDAQYSKANGESYGGLCPLSVGTKVKLFDGYKALPKIGLLCNLTIPSGKTEYYCNYVAPQVYLLFDNDITDKFSIGYNVGAEWDGESANPNTFFALCLGFSFTDKFGAFVENYGYFNTESKPVWLTEFGVSYQVAPRVQLDLAGDLNLKEPGKNYAVSFGVAWLIN
ncbi:MAG: transporter [Paludibacteraceae bacterium]|nr:transporter [Paludibacteraceae bacterium]